MTIVSLASEYAGYVTGVGAALGVLWAGLTRTGKWIVDQAKAGDAALAAQLTSTKDDLTDTITDRVDDVLDQAKAGDTALDTRITVLVTRFEAAEAERERVIADVQHRSRNLAARTDAIEHARTADIERIVRLETTLTGLANSQDRIERMIVERFDTLAVSIREIRDVRPRP